jgi:hypothetical protein
MAKKAKTWAEKMTRPHAPQVRVLDRTFAQHPAGTRMLISTPQEIASFIQDIPPGKTVAVAEMRDALAHSHRALFTCPLTTGIFLRVAAEEACERLAQGAATDEVTPFWRIVGPKDPLGKKLSCGAEALTRLRRLEGIS